MSEGAYAAQRSGVEPPATGLQRVIGGQANLWAALWIGAAVLFLLFVRSGMKSSVVK